MLLREGVRVGRRQLGTLMQRMGIEVLCPEPGTSVRNPQHKVNPYLLRKVDICRANQVWALDTTYIRMARGFVYLTAVVDVANRRVLAQKVAITLKACHACEFIEQAYARFGGPEIVNTIRAASSQSKTSPGLSSRAVATWPCTARGPGATTCLSSACGERSSTSGCTCVPATT